MKHFGSILRKEINGQLPRGSCLSRMHTQEIYTGSKIFIEKKEKEAMKMENPIDSVVCGDCLKIIPKIPDDSIDLVITSPPFNVNLQGYDTYHDLKEQDVYIRWLIRIFRVLLPKLKSGARLALNIGDGRNGRIPTHSDIIHAMTRQLHYLMMTTIIWDRENTSCRTAWGTYNSPAAPAFPTPWGYILVFAKDSLRLMEKGETDLSGDEFVRWSMSMWRPLKMEYQDATNIMRNKTHPAPFPEVIPERLMKMLSWKGAVVLDPFGGVGTVALAAKRNNRHYISIDISEKYCAYARERLKHVLAPGSLFEE